MDDMKSPVTCMLIINDYLWVGSHSGVKVYNAANRQLIGLWVTKTVVAMMILVPYGHHSDKEALVMLTKSSTILIFTVLQWQKQRLLQDVKPDHEIDMHCEILCALLVPIINQLWVCTTDNKLVIFNSGCYDNHEKYDVPDMKQPCCMATIDDHVLVAGGAKIQKWSAMETPSAISCLDCTGTIMEKISTIQYDGESLVGNN